MQPTQALSLSVSLLHVGLLAGVYISAGGAQSQVFVSTVLDGQVFFKVLLTIVVVLEAHIAAAYIYLSGPSPASHGLLAASTLCLLLALSGWTALACTRMGEPWHQAGTILFLLGTAGYNLALISRSASHRWIYATLWGAVLACAVAFLTTNYAQDYPTAALCEWMSFMLQGSVLAVYFYENPLQGRPDSHASTVVAGQAQAQAQQQQQQQRKRGAGGKEVGAEAAMPLLLVVNGAPASHQQQLVAAGRPLSGRGGLSAVHEEYAEYDDEEGGWGARW